DRRVPAEVHPQVELPRRGVAELLAVEDVQVQPDHRAGDRVDDAPPVGAVEGEDDLAAEVAGDGLAHSAPELVAASWPQAPSMSAPRVSRTVVRIPCARSRSTNCCSTPGREAVHFDPGVGLSGMGLMCSQPFPRAVSFSASRSARQAWSLMSRIIAYSMLTRRPVARR